MTLAPYVVGCRGAPMAHVSTFHRPIAVHPPPVSLVGTVANAVFGVAAGIAAVFVLALGITLIMLGGVATVGAIGLAAFVGVCGGLIDRQAERRRRGRSFRHGPT